MKWVGFLKFRAPIGSLESWRSAAKLTHRTLESWIVDVCDTAATVALAPPPEFSEFESTCSHAQRIDELCYKCDPVLGIPEIAE